MELLFHAGEPEKLEAVSSPLIERFSRSRGLLVLNDEAHHVWDETGHAKFEQKAKEKARVTKDDETAQDMAWIRSNPAPERRRAGAGARGPAGGPVGDAIRGGGRGHQVEQGGQEVRHGVQARRSVPAHLRVLPARRRNPRRHRQEAGAGAGGGPQQEDRRDRAAHPRGPAKRLGEVPQPAGHRHRALEEGQGAARRRRRPAQAHPVHPVERPQRGARGGQLPALRRGRARRPGRAGRSRATRTGKAAAVRGQERRRGPVHGGRDPHRREGGTQRGRLGCRPALGQCRGSRRDPEARRRRHAGAGQPGSAGHGAQPLQRRGQRDDAEGGLGRPEREGHRAAAALRLAHPDRADAGPGPAQDAPAHHRRGGRLVR